MKLRNLRTILPAFLLLLLPAVTLAQGPGAEVYRRECVHCHGADGMAQTGLGRSLKVKPITDSAVKGMSLDAMLEATRNGMGKMQPYKANLTDAQIRASVLYFRSFIK